MPVIPLVSRENNYLSDAGPRSPLSEEEQRAADESLRVYCEPVELYNILERRATKNPSFLQRCLRYKIQEKNKTRVQMSLSISGSSDDEQQTKSLFPLYSLLARPISTPNGEMLCSSFFRFRRACKLTAVGSNEAKFLLPEINKLSAEVKSGSLVMLLVSCADTSNTNEIDLTMDHMFSSLSDGYCLLGKIPLSILRLPWEKSPDLNLEGKVQVMSTVKMQACTMKLRFSDERKCISFHFPHDSEDVSIVQQVPVIITAEELGAKDESAYDKCFPADLLPPVIRLRKGNVNFNFRYYNNTLQKTEVTEDFSCPFCLIKCGSFKGLKCHLNSSHDLFHYELWEIGYYQVVIVYPKTSDYTSEILGNMVDPREEPFFFCHKPLRSSSRNQNVNHVGRLALVSNMSGTLSHLRGVSERMECESYSPIAAGVSSTAGIKSSRPESAAQTVLESSTAPTSLLQFAKSRKLSIEHSDPRSRALLLKRSFFHSRTAQPMALEQVFAEEDSEDEFDDDVADLEDRRMLDDFDDVSQDEKQLMHLWNSFIRKQRVLADAQIPWACQAFLNCHGENLVHTPQLNWCWRVFLVKLWNHGLLDAKTINNCQTMVDKFRHQEQIPVIG